MKKKGFTLAEVMVVLSVIGILTAVLLPIVANSTPDKNVMKFKKADTTLKNVIRELVNSDKYYADGDLGLRASDKKLIDGTNSGDKTYLCNSIADVLSTKKVNCSQYSGAIMEPYSDVAISNDEESLKISWIRTKEEAGEWMDKACKSVAKNIGAEITTTDGIAYYQTNPSLLFGANHSDARATFHDPDGTDICTGKEDWCQRRFFPGPDTEGATEGATFKDTQGFAIMHKLFCIDIDGIPNEGSENCDDDKDICPFGYAIRVDGKIVEGIRATDWLAKDFQGKDPSEQE